ncbi:MAG: hypothetical protein IT167_01555, partial [Bryobacterales bacterium]|nr:hypothetical protein [Bryobacterales bacterium]
MRQPRDMPALVYLHENNPSGSAEEPRCCIKERSGFAEALGLQPDYLDGRLQLGLLLSRKNDPFGAANVYREIIRRKPDFAEARNNLGLAL